MKIADVLGEEFSFFAEQGYEPNRDPKMLAAEPDLQATFVNKHMNDEDDDPERVTDVDKSTLDDDLFKGANLKRSVPFGDDTHGHTPTGKDAAVYEGVGLLARLAAARKVIDDVVDAGYDPDNQTERAQDAIDAAVSGPSAASRLAGRVSEERLLEKVGLKTRPFSGESEPLKNGVRDTDGKPTSDKTTKIRDEEEGD